MSSSSAWQPAGGFPTCATCNRPVDHAGDTWWQQSEGVVSCRACVIAALPENVMRRERDAALAEVARLRAIETAARTFVFHPEHGPVPHRMDCDGRCDCGLLALRVALDAGAPGAAPEATG